jgi:hypothetical protein
VRKDTLEDPSAFELLSVITAQIERLVRAKRSDAGKTPSCPRMAQRLPRGLQPLRRGGTS